MFGSKDSLTPIAEVADFRIPSIPFDNVSRAIGPSNIPYLREVACKEAPTAERRALAQKCYPYRVLLSSHKISMWLGPANLNELTLALLNQLSATLKKPKSRNNSPFVTTLCIP